MAAPHPLIETCACIADGVRDELRAILKAGTARTSQFDRLTAKKIEYAIRKVEEVAARIRGLNADAPVSTAPKPDAERFAEAIALLSEMRPTISRMSNGGMWRLKTLRKIDELMPK